MPKGQAFVLFVHGVGSQKPGYSAKARRTMGAALALRGITMHSSEVCWAPVLDRLQQKMLKDVGKRGSKNNLAQRLAIGTLSDALCYQNNRDQILDLMDQGMVRLRSDSVHIVGHSLGVVVAHDWLRSRPVVNATLTSLGCNAELFSLGARFNCPNQLRAEGRWRNFWYATDVLGFPVAGWQEQVIDQEITRPVWSISRLVPGLSHLSYWDDSRLFGSTMPAGFR